MRRERVYVNTSILIRAVNPREPMHEEAQRFIWELAGRGYVLVISSVHEVERFRRGTLVGLVRLFARCGFRVCKVDVSLVRREAGHYISARRLSPSRLLDVMHLIAARKCGCSFIAAVDRFIKVHAEEFGLRYINYYTGIP